MPSPTTPSDDQVTSAVAGIRRSQPDLGRAKLRDLLREQHAWQVSDARLKKLLAPPAPAPAQQQQQPRRSAPPPPQARTKDDPALDAAVRTVRHWLDEAHKSADARRLAKELGLELPKGDPYGYKAGLMYPIHRLVVTGKDTPANFRTLFGVDSVPDVHAVARQAVLMSSNRKTKSPAQMTNGFLDQGCPYWAPRPATADEKDGIRQQLELEKQMGMS